MDKLARNETGTILKAISRMVDVHVPTTIKHIFRQICRMCQHQQKTVDQVPNIAEKIGTTLEESSRGYQNSGQSCGQQIQSGPTHKELSLQSQLIPL